MVKLTNQPTNQPSEFQARLEITMAGGQASPRGVPQREMAQLSIANTAGPSHTPRRECGCLAPSRAEDKAGGTVPVCRGPAG